MFFISAVIVSQIALAAPNQPAPPQGPLGQFITNIGKGVDNVLHQTVKGITTPLAALSDGIGNVAGGVGDLLVNGVVGGALDIITGDDGSDDDMGPENMGAIDASMLAVDPPTVDDPLFPVATQNGPNINPIMPILLAESSAPVRPQVPAQQSNTPSVAPSTAQVSSAQVVQAPPTAQVSSAQVVQAPPTAQVSSAQVVQQQAVQQPVVTSSVQSAAASSTAPVSSKPTAAAPSPSASQASLQTMAPSVASVTTIKPASSTTSRAATTTLSVAITNMIVKSSSSEAPMVTSIIPFAEPTNVAAPIIDAPIAAKVEDTYFDGGSIISSAIVPSFQHVFALASIFLVL